MTVIALTLTEASLMLWPSMVTTQRLFSFSYMTTLAWIAVSFERTLIANELFCLAPNNVSPRNLVKY
jgi:hypothetical protein